MRILITGASGLLGINLALEAAKVHTVFGSVYSHRFKTEAFETLAVDLTAPAAVENLLEQVQPEWVIHCAALANLEACEVNPDLAHQLNTLLPAKLAQHVARGGARLLHVSTDSVFDGSRGNYTEDDEPHPINVYAQTKLAGEKAVLETNPQAIVARVNLFGWSLTGQRSLAEFFFNNLEAGKQVMGFTDVYFCPLLANDLAHIFLKMLANSLSGLYHVVSQECSSKYNFGVAIARKFGLDENLITPTSVEHSGLRAARSPYLTLRSDRLAAALGEVTPDLSTGIEGLYSLFRQGYRQELRALAVSA